MKRKIIGDSSTDLNKSLRENFKIDKTWLHTFDFSHELSQKKSFFF